MFEASEFSLNGYLPAVVSPYIDFTLGVGFNAFGTRYNAAALLFVAVPVSFYMCPAVEMGKRPCVCEPCKRYTQLKYCVWGGEPEVATSGTKGLVAPGPGGGIEDWA